MSQKRNILKEFFETCIYGYSGENDYVKKDRECVIKPRGHSGGKCELLNCKHSK